MNVEQKIDYLSNNQILFNGLKGFLVVNHDKLMFINQILKINSNNYDSIYWLDDGWAGCYLFIKDNTYRFIQCGSGVPIVYDIVGTLVF
jgi:hypothetical protein